MSNSSLVSYTKLSPNKSSRNGNKIKKITPHHMAGILSAKECGDIFAPSARQASSNYGIGKDGEVGLYVDESERAWTSSNAANDRQAVTIEISNDQIGGSWHVSYKCWNTLVDLCVDICKRNNIPKLIWTGDSSGTLTCHRMFAATSCPGDYLWNRMQELADTVNAKLSGTTAPSPSPSQPSTPTPSGTTSNFGGTYRCTDAAKPYLNVRTGYGLNAPLAYHNGKPVRYTPGQTVVLDNWYKIADGYVWGRYTGATTGLTRYVAVGKATGKPEANDFLVKI